MHLDAAQRAALDLASQVKEDLVAFALTPPFERHLRRISREVHGADHYLDPYDAEVGAVEQLLFAFRYDDGTSVAHRWVARRDVDDDQRAMALGFLDGVESFFETLDPVEPGDEAFRVRCCVSDLEHLIAPTIPDAMPQLERGAFLAGRFNPVARTDLWTLSGTLEAFSAGRRDDVASVVMSMALQRPELTHRNPEKRRIALERSAAMHEAFVARHGTDMLTSTGLELKDVYADATAPDSDDPDVLASARASAYETIEGFELADDDDVLVHSHPVGGFGFYREFSALAQTLEAGAAADASGLELLRGYLDDETVPAWVLRRVITDRLPASAAAVGLALRRPDLDWARDGGAVIAAAPGVHEPTLALAIVPSMCSGSADRT